MNVATSPMNPKILLLLLSATAAGGVDAQQLYKSVGPDGKVTFSDRPPGGNGKISVMKSNILRPLNQELPPSTLAATAKPVREPAAAAGGSSAAASNGPSTPELEEAVSAVLLMSEVAKRFEPICSPTPTAAKQYSVAVTGWRSRNANFLDKQNRILMEVIDPAKRAAMVTKVNGRVSESLSEVSSLNAAWRTKWCDRAVLEMTGKVNDVANNAAIAIPLISYKLK